MTKTAQLTWKGVFPAVTTQFGNDMSLDIEATQRTVRQLVTEGVHGIVTLGTVGENNSQLASEKRQIVDAVVDAVAGAVPVIVGVSELTTALACEFAADVSDTGASGLMVLPAMAYSPTRQEMIRHFASVASNTDLPIMVYNNPLAYHVNIDLPALEELSALENIVSIKESAPDPRRVTDIINRFGDRFAVLAGLDDIALECLFLGAQGWVSGLTNVFPRESVSMYNALVDGDLDLARSIYRWFMPMLHLDADHDLVQAIKLAEEIVGRGRETVRMPRLPLSGARRAEIVGMVEKATTTSPLAAQLVAG